MARYGYNFKKDVGWYVYYIDDNGQEKFAVWCPGEQYACQVATDANRGLLATEVAKTEVAPPVIKDVMNRQVVLLTQHELDFAWIPELHKAGFGTYVYPKTNMEDLDVLWDFVVKTNPKLLLIDEELNDQIIDFALKVYQNALTKDTWIFFLSRRRSELPPYAPKLWQGHEKYRFQTRPYGVAEILLVINHWMNDEKY